MKIELLAPAKDKETAIAAIDCGADAIYVGATSFGARQNANNSLEDIQEIVDYAHKYWVKVFVTLNTILTDDELKSAVDMAKKLNDIGADALIIQDMGLLNELMKIELKIPLHMSTQCDNYLPEKVKFFNDIGVKRVILARESSIERIKQIHKENPNLELENFVHGALCVSFSGQCYLSQYIGGRSANRGECAQPCRKKYSVVTKDGKVIKKDFYALCLKDFNASNCLEKLIEAGITSFKIEGRLKDINYVKNIVSYYNQKFGRKNRASSGMVECSFVPNPDKSFNRGYTEYFLQKREECFNFSSPKSQGEYLGKVVEVRKNSFRLDTEKNISPQDGLCFGDKGFLVNKVENSYIYPNKQIDIKLGTKIYRNSDIEFAKQLSQKVKRQIGINVSVTNKYITLTDEDNISVMLALPQGEAPNNPDKMKETFIKQFSKTGGSDFYVKTIKVDDIDFIQVSKINELRRNSFAILMDKRIEYYEKNVKQIQKPMKYVKYYRKEVDYRANVHNLSAKEFYHKCSCTVIEPSLETKIPNRQVALMRTKHCVKYALNMCKSPQELFLKDDCNNLYPLKFDCKNCEMEVLCKGFIMRPLAAFVVLVVPAVLVSLLPLHNSFLGFY